MPGLWSIEEYCSKQKDLLIHNDDSIPSFNSDGQFWSTLLGENDFESNRKFLVDLNLPTVHPFCIESFPATFGNDTSIPPMGRLDFLHEIQITGTGNESGGYSFQALLSLWYLVAPALLAMAELWVRLFAGLFGPVGTFYLLLWNKDALWENKAKPVPIRKLCLAILLAVSSSLVLMTDTLYVLQNGPGYGITLFLASLTLAFRLCRIHNLKRTSLILVGLVLLSVHLVTRQETGWDTSIHFGDPVDEVRLPEGLYFDPGNSLVSNIAKRWPETFRMYDKEHGMTTWMPTGDSRTGLPFIIHKYDPREYPNWVRVFVEVQEEKDLEPEYLALDISFPKTGHDPTKPIYFILHGLSGGSMEEYIRDVTIRRNAENSTVIVMIARGMMDTPIKGWNIFHGARTSDAHTAASVINHRALAKGQILVGAGYSMGAIIIANYVASYGKDCALDAAVAVSGGLDMRYQEHFYRAQRLWQPMLAGTLRDDFLLGKFGHLAKAKLTPEEYLKVLRATHITEIDRYAIVALNGFDDLDHYYRTMSALGDIPHDPDTDELVDANRSGKIHDVSIPMLVVHAFDDPLVTWRATVQNSGFMHPENLVKSGSGNLMLLLTKAGGHVGWSLGLWPTKYKWKWMSDIVMSFAQSVDVAKKEMNDE